MLYYAYELNHAALAPLREAAGFGKKLLESPFNPFAQTVGGRTVSAAFDLFESMTRRYGKPLWRLSETTVNGFPVGIKDRAIWQRPFCQLIHFERDKNALLQARGKIQADPRVLIIAPLSGHYATLLRRTVESFLPDHEVFVSIGRTRVRCRSSMASSI
jgi:poly(3-hydroxybutyrate) depolymerase